MVKVNRILCNILKALFIVLLFILIVNSLSIFLASMDSLLFNFKLYVRRIDKIAFFIEPMLFIINTSKIDVLFVNENIFTSSSIIILLFYISVLLIIFVSLFFSFYVYKGIFRFYLTKKITKAIIIFIFLQLYSILIIVLSNAKLTKIGFLFNVDECKIWHIVISLVFYLFIIFLMFFNRNINE